MRQFTFTSAFGERISGFLDDRTARGYNPETWIRHFIKFDRWIAETHPDLTELTREAVHEWLNDDSASPHDLSQRASAMRMFGKYLHALGENAYILPGKYTPMKPAAVPYIFTDAEMTALFAEIDDLPPTKTEPFLNEMAPTLFRLIYTCGLRPNEGRELLTGNVRLDTGEVLLTNTKGRKERVVVMSDEMLEMARKYAERRNVFANGNPYFFPSANGGAMASPTVCAAFQKAWSLAQPSNVPPRRVRVYDLRHRFASARLQLWLDSGENLDAMLPFLREYMGHRKFEDTAYYIHILPENLLKSPSVDWARFETMFPEVKP